METKLINLVSYFEEFYAVDNSKAAAEVSFDIYGELIEMGYLPSEIKDTFYLIYSLDEKGVEIGKPLAVILGEIARLDLNRIEEKDNKYMATVSALVIAGSTIVASKSPELFDFTTDSREELVDNLVASCNAAKEYVPEGMEIEVLPMQKREDVLAVFEDLGLEDLGKYLSNDGKSFVIVATYIGEYLAGLVIHTIYELSNSTRMLEI